MFALYEERLWSDRVKLFSKYDDVAGFSWDLDNFPFDGLNYVLLLL